MGGIAEVRMELTVVPEGLFTDLQKENSRVVIACINCVRWLHCGFGAFATAGNYKFMEFAKIGLPCQLFMIVAVLYIFLLEDHIWVAMGFAFAAMALVMAGPLLWATLSPKTKERLTPARFRKRKAKTDAVDTYDKTST